MAQGYSKEEGIDYEETYVHVVQLEAIKLLLAYASSKNFKLYQIDIKNAFLKGYINKEVYVSQPLGFENFEYPDHLFKLKQALYGLKQALRVWYDKLSSLQLNHWYSRVKVDSILFIRHEGKHLLLVQIYVDDHFWIF